MGVPLWASIFRWRSLRRNWLWLILLGTIGFVRWTKGIGFADTYALISKPFWPGSVQQEWLQSGVQLEQQIRLKLLEEDNQRLREMLSLQNSSNQRLVSAVVIARTPKGWWQKLELGKGSIDDIARGDVVIGPGGLLGSISSVTPTTSRVRLLTSPGSRIGVWVPRTKRHGILMGMGTNRPQLLFFDKDPKVVPGDVVSTSPASTLMPPNLSVGVIQSIEKNALLAPSASVQLLASPEAIDWVQVQKF